MQMFRRGDTGPAVEEVRATLSALGLLEQPWLLSGEAEVFDDATDRAVRAFQQRRGVTVDGLVGPETYAALQAARLSLGDRILLHVPGRLLGGDDVAALQERLLELGFDAGRVDSLFGTRTEQALVRFQREYGLVSDGVCGPATLRALKQLGRLVTGGRPQAMRESEALHRSGVSLAGKVVVLDPGHGGSDPGATGHGLQEAVLVMDLAARLEGRLTAVGVQTLLTRGPDSCPDDADRAGLANRARADLVLSLHVDRADSPACHGVATYHYGTVPSGRAGAGTGGSGCATGGSGAGTGASGTGGSGTDASGAGGSGAGTGAGSGTGVTSTVGERLAGLVQRELVARTDLLDCRTHAKSWSLLRLTSMPTVRVELGHVSNAGDAARLDDPAFRDTVSEALLVAVQRLFLPKDLDSPTGIMRLPDLAHLA